MKNKLIKILRSVVDKLEDTQTRPVRLQVASDLNVPLHEVFVKDMFPEVGLDVVRVVVPTRLWLEVPNNFRKPDWESLKSTKFEASPETYFSKFEATYGKRHPSDNRPLSESQLAVNREKAELARVEAEGASVARKAMVELELKRMNQPVPQIIFPTGLTNTN